MKHELIQVKYRNSQEGFVDDVTLNELILSRKIRHFYRPSQEKWIDIETDPVRIGETQYGGPERRKPDEEEESEQFAPRKALTAEDWLMRGYKALYNEDDSKRALRAFAKSIHLEPAHLGAYFNRGITYERVGNLQQAIDDYSKAIELAPGDAAVYYLRGRARKRLGMDNEAIEDLEKAARMGYRKADVKAVTPARGVIPSSTLPQTEKPEMLDVVKLRNQLEKPPSLEKKKRKNRFPLIASLGFFCAFILVLVAVFFWPTKPDDFISSTGKIYPPRSDKPTDKSVIVPPFEDAKPKGQTEHLSVINLSKSAKGKEYSVQIRAYPESGKNAATEFVTKLRRIQPDVYMERVDIPERGVWYRILVGHFASVEEASTYLKEKKIFEAYPGSFVQLTSEKQSLPKEDYGHIKPQ